MMLEPVITESAVGVSMIGILALLALLGMLLGAVVLVGVLLANRHTRGVGLGLLAAGGIGLVLLATWISWGRIASHDSHSRMARHETPNGNGARNPQRSGCNALRSLPTTTRRNR